MEYFKISKKIYKNMTQGGLNLTQVIKCKNIVIYKFQNRI